MDQNRLGAMKRLEELKKAAITSKEAAETAGDEAPPGHACVCFMRHKLIISGSIVMAAAIPKSVTSGFGATTACSAADSFTVRL
jgi:hypothetical protein